MDCNFSIFQYSINVTLLGDCSHEMYVIELSIVRDRLQFYKKKLTIFQLIANSVPFWSAIENYTFLFFEFFRCPWSRDTTNLHPHNQNWRNRSYLHCARLTQSWSGLVQRWQSFRGETRNFRPSWQQAFHYSNWHQRANLRCLQMQSH